MTGDLYLMDPEGTPRLVEVLPDQDVPGKVHVRQHTGPWRGSTMHVVPLDLLPREGFAVAAERYAVRAYEDAKRSVQTV